MKPEIAAKVGPKPTIDFTTATLDDVVAYRDAMGQYQRKIEFYSAKTNLGRLVAQGVITYDDGTGEWERSMQYDAAKATAQVENGGSPPTPQEINAVIARQEQAAKVYAARSWLVYNVFAGFESPDERAERVARLIAEYDGRTPKGRRCTHPASKSQQYSMDNDDDGPDSIRFTCTGCGADLTIPPPSQPNAQAIAAARLAGWETFIHRTAGAYSFDPKVRALGQWPAVCQRSFVFVASDGTTTQTFGDWIAALPADADPMRVVYDSTMVIGSAAHREARILRDGTVVSLDEHVENSERAVNDLHGV